MDHAAAANAWRSRPLAFAAAVGWPAVLAVGVGGATAGFFLWYALAVRGPRGAAPLELLFAACLIAGTAGTYAAWLAYGRYVARRSHVDLLTVLRYDAASWACMTLLWAVLLAPSGGHGNGRVIVLAAGLAALAKLAAAARFNRTVRDVTITFLVTRIPLVAIAEFATVVIGQRPGTHFAASANPFLAVWGRWDAEHYLGIAKLGYSGTEPAFFPLYPLLIRIVGVLTGSHLIAGLLVSNAASFLGLLYLYKLVEHEYNRHVAQRATFYIAIFPTAIFFSTVYSESLFLFLTVAAFYYVRERRWLTAGVFGFFAALTRSEGVLLAVPFFIEWIVAAREGGREYFKYTWSNVVQPYLGMALVPLGLGCYMAYLWAINGDPLRFSHVQKHWGRHFAPPWDSLINTVNKIAHAHAGQTIANQSFELLATLLMIVVLIVGARRLRLSYTVYMALSVLVPMCTASLMSMPRFALVLFPMFALFGLWGGRQGWNNAYVAFSLPLLGLFTVLFADWYWVA